MPVEPGGLKLANTLVFEPRGDCLTVGVVSDTHIPERVAKLHPDLLPGLRAAGVELILHAGDISLPGVLRDLESIAPVVAVRGNRDFAFGERLPLVQMLSLAGISTALLHGHGGALDYVRTKIFFLTKGYDFKIFKAQAQKSAPESRVYVFGHSHYPENRWIDGKLYFNPGSASYNLKTGHVSYGILKFYRSGAVEGTIEPLTPLTIKNRQWSGES